MTEEVFIEAIKVAGNVAASASTNPQLFVVHDNPADYIAGIFLNMFFSINEKYEETFEPDPGEESP